MTRVMIVGDQARLSHLLSYHMDQLSWRSGFVHRTTSELDA